MKNHLQLASKTAVHADSHPGQFDVISGVGLRFVYDLSRPSRTLESRQSVSPSEICRRHSLKIWAHLCELSLEAEIEDLCLVSAGVLVEKER
jgi:hypothetical protein